MVNKVKLRELFENVLLNWENAERYVIQDTIVDYDNEYNQEDLARDVEDFRNEFNKLLK